MKQAERKRLLCQRGTTVVEIALLLSLISVVSIASVQFAGDATAGSMQVVGDAINGGQQLRPFGGGTRAEVGGGGNSKETSYPR